VLPFRYLHHLLRLLQRLLCLALRVYGLEGFFRRLETAPKVILQRNMSAVLSYGKERPQARRALRTQNALTRLSSESSDSSGPSL